MKNNIEKVDKKDGKLLSLTLHVGSEEEEMFRSLVRSEGYHQTCPHCETEFDVTNSTCESMLLKIDNPLFSSGLGIEMATPMFVCPHCSYLMPMSMIDYSPFTSAITFVRELRKKYKEKKSGGK